MTEDEGSGRVAGLLALEGWAGQCAGCGIHSFSEGFLLRFWPSKMKAPLARESYSNSTRDSKSAGKVLHSEKPLHFLAYQKHSNYG